MTTKFRFLNYLLYMAFFVLLWNLPRECLWDKIGLNHQEHAIESDIDLNARVEKEISKINEGKYAHCVHFNIDSCGYLMKDSLMEDINPGRTNDTEYVNEIIKKNYKIAALVDKAIPKIKQKMDALAATKKCMDEHPALDKQNNVDVNNLDKAVSSAMIDCSKEGVIQIKGVIQTSKTKEDR